MQINNINFGSTFKINLHLRNKKVENNEDLVRFALNYSGVNADKIDDLFNGKSYNINVPNKKDHFILELCKEFNIPICKVKNN